jgi:hypothetical protein
MQGWRGDVQHRANAQAAPTRLIGRQGRPAKISSRKDTSARGGRAARMWIARQLKARFDQAISRDSDESQRALGVPSG